MAKSRGRKFAEITSPASGVFDLTSVPTITNAKLQNSAMTLAGSSVSLGGTGVADTDALSEGSSNVYFTDARVQTFLGGGTLAGNIVVPDNRSIYVGSSSDFRIIHNTTNTQLTNTTGALQITSSGALALSGSYVAVTGAATFSSTITATGNITGTLATAAQPNITSLGTLSALTISGGLTATNATFTSTGGNFILKHAGTGSASTPWVQFKDGNDTNLGYVGYGSSGNSTMYIVNQGASNTGDIILYAGSQARLTVHNDGTLDSDGPIQINATTVIDTSRNLTNIGSITSSGNISISAASGNPYVSIKTAGTGNNPYTEYRAGNNTVFDTTGVFSTTTDRFRIGYGSSGTVDTEILSVLSDGRVGINKDAPNAHSQLHIAHGPYAFVTLDSTDSGGRQYEIFSYASDSSFHVYDRTGSKYRMTIDSAGEVGIGTNAPAENLHVSSTETGDHTRIHIEKTSTAGTAGLSMTSTSAAHTWTIFQNDDSEGLLNFFNSAANVNPLRLTKDGTAGINAVPVSWYAGQAMLQLGAQMTLHSENASATSNSAHISLNAQLDTDGSWEYIVSNQATNYYQYEGAHTWRQTTSGTAGADISWYNTMTLAPDVGVLQLNPVGYMNGPKTHAALNIGKAGNGETRAIDIWGSWSANEHKSITFNHGNSASNIVGQINCIHYSPASAIRWGKLYHNAEGNTYTMELRSVSQSTSRLIINNSNIPGDAPINVQAGPGSTGCFVGRSQSYTNPFGILPWSSGITYLSSGTHYTNGNWEYAQSTGSQADACLFYISGESGIKWYVGDSNGPGGSSVQWNVANAVTLFNRSGVMVASTGSDRRLKENITNLDSTDALTKVKALQAVSFEWNDTIKRKRATGHPDGIQYGFIAQDVKEVWPDAHIISDHDFYVEDTPTETMDKNDTYYGDIEGVRQEKLIPLLVESIKAQQAMIEALQAEVAALKE